MFNFTRKHLLLIGPKRLECKRLNVADVTNSKHTKSQQSTFFFMMTEQSFCFIFAFVSFMRFSDHEPNAATQHGGGGLKVSVCFQIRILF